MKVKSLSPVRLLVTPWTAAYQAPPSMGFSRQEYWSGVPLPSLKRNYTAAQNVFCHLRGINKCVKEIKDKLSWRRLVGCSPWDREESDTTERLYFHFSLSCIGEGNGNPLQYSCLENPRDGGAWWAAVYGVAQSRARLKRLSSSSSRGREVAEGTARG